MSSLELLEYETGANPAATIIVMHGLGADGRDFESFVHELKLDAVGPIRYVFPNAPEIPVTINGGYVMRAWYDIVGTDLARREDAAGLRQSRGLIDALVEREVKRGVPARRIVLSGFSQGGAMTLMTGLRHPERLAGLACLSGYLPLADSTEAELAPANRNVPIFLVHGQQDPVIPLTRAQASRDALLALGFEVEWHDYPMPHSVCLEELADLNRWLLRVLAA